MTSALVIQLIASALTLAGSWFYGNKSPLGPWFGIASQVPWNIIMVTGGLWCLAPVNIIMLIIHVRNLIKWRADAQPLRRRDVVQQSEAGDTVTVQGNRRQRRAAKAYETIAGGELR